MSEDKKPSRLGVILENSDELVRYYRKGGSATDSDFPDVNKGKQAVEDSQIVQREGAVQEVSDKTSKRLGAVLGTSRKALRDLKWEDESGSGGGSGPDVAP